MMVIFVLLKITCCYGNRAYQISNFPFTESNIRMAKTITCSELFQNSLKRIKGASPDFVTSLIIGYKVYLF